jgi:hypothetical protein
LFLSRRVTVLKSSEAEGWRVEDLEMPPKKASRMWALETAKKILAGMEEVMVALTLFFLLSACICTHHI